MNGSPLEVVDVSSELEAQTKVAVVVFAAVGVILASYTLAEFLILFRHVGTYVDYISLKVNICGLGSDLAFFITNVSVFWCSAGLQKLPTLANPFSDLD